MTHLANVSSEPVCGASSRTEVKDVDRVDCVDCLRAEVKAWQRVSAHLTRRLKESQEERPCSG